MVKYSFFVGQDMNDFVQKILTLLDTDLLMTQKRHNLAYDKARIAHESSQKSSVSKFCDSLVSSG